jgi:hypothetical protein
VYSDTVHVPALAAGTSRQLHFDPIFLADLKKYNLSINILNPPQNDYNARNNKYQASLTATKLLDDFESESGHWIFMGGWGITNVFGGVSGIFAAQVNSGKKYEPNMDAVMTLELGLNFHGAANPVLKFWTKYSTVTDKDVLYIESSSDSLTWVKIDSLTGNIYKWTQESVNLTPIVQSGGPTAWVRFHFISRSTMKKMGFLIDDVEIYADPMGVVDEGRLNHDNSITWYLSQNYPNPFNATTEILFTIPQRSSVILKVFDLLGRELATLRDEMLPAGAHSAVFDAAHLTTGVYFVRISAGEFNAIKKLLVIR